MRTSLTVLRLEESLATPIGWMELAIVIACFAISWIVDRRIARYRAQTLDISPLSGSFARLAMPIIALLMLLVLRAVWTRFAPLPPLFLGVGISLAVALAVIRIIVFTLRRLVPNAAWLRKSERTVISIVWGLVMLHLLGITPEIADELESLRIPFGRTQMTALTVIKAAFAVVLTLAITLWLSGLVEQRLMKSRLDLSQRALVSKFVRALLLVIGVLAAFQVIGFDLTVLSVFGGALGVGIGLGLQKLASNYIAGYVILLDRSIRLGDLITVDSRHGVVSEVTTRYVVVRGMDGVEAIVPNETLIATTVLNHSSPRAAVRLALTIQVIYGTDLDRALDLMREAAMQQPRVLKDGEHAPQAYVKRFPDTGVELELEVWISDPERSQLALRSSLNRAVWNAFMTGGIGVPFTPKDMKYFPLPPAEPEPVPAAPANPAMATTPAAVPNTATRATPGATGSG